MASSRGTVLFAMAVLGLLQFSVSQAAPPEDPPPVWRNAPSRYDSGPQRYDRGPAERSYQGPPPGGRASRGRSPYGNMRLASMQAEPDPYISGESAPPPQYNTQGQEVYDGGYDQGPYDGEFYDDYGWDEGCDCCYGSCRGPIYVRGEYLLWWINGDSTPALVTTSPDNTPRAQAGVLGQPNTTVLFGDNRMNTNAFSGGRVVLGWWINPSARIEGEFFGLGQNNTGFSQTSTGSPILARPFFNLTTGTQDSNVIAFPGQLQGAVSASYNTTFLGAGIHATENLICQDYCDRHHRLDFVYGFRYLHLREDLGVNSSTTTIGAAQPIPVNTTFTVSDSFATTNNFFGGTVGMMAEERLSRWCLTGIGRLSVGGTSERVDIAGNSSSRTPAGVTTNSNGGLLAMPTNIGTYHHGAFTLVPQIELKLGYDWTDNIRFTIGYDVIYWSRVARPGQQIDTFVNTSQASGGTLVGTPGPRFTLRESDLWVQGLSFGGEWRF